MKYLAILGRLTGISLAELESLFSNVEYRGGELATFEMDSSEEVDFSRLGGVMKIGEEILGGRDSLLEFLAELPEGKITLGVSDFRRGASAKKAQIEALKLKKALKKARRSVRVLENKTAVLSTATSHHNQLAEKKNHVEIIFTEFGIFNLKFVQNISKYAKRDQQRPARDAKVGMLPPKLAQILINLCGRLPEGSRVLDPFCGTGVVLQEAGLMGYRVVGTDLNERMVKFTEKNLAWLEKAEFLTEEEKRDIIERYCDKILAVGDATETDWNELLKKEGVKGEISAIATEAFLGQPMSVPPAEIKMKQEKEKCRTIILGFLKNLSGQIKSGTSVVMAVPAWLRENGEYSRLNILDEAENLGYNVKKFISLRQRDLLYYREGQIVAREIIVLRKK